MPFEFSSVPLAPALYAFDYQIMHITLNDTNETALIRRRKAAMDEKTFVAKCTLEKADVCLLHIQENCIGWTII